MVVEIFQGNFFLSMLAKHIFQNLMTALRPQRSPQFFYDAAALLNRIKNNSLHVLV